MNTYGSKLKLMGKNVGKAFAIALGVGLIISICAGFFGESFGTGVENTLAFGIVLGSLLSLVTTAKAGTASSLASMGMSFVHHLFLTCISTIGTWSIFGLVIGLVGLLVTAGIGLVMMLFLAISFPLNLLYLIVMTVLEQVKRLPSEEVTIILDKAVPAVCGIASVVITWTMFASM